MPPTPTTKPCRRAILMTVLCLAPAAISSASSAITTVAHYDVSSRGFRVGTVTTTQQITGEGPGVTVRFETKTNVKASFLWIGYHQAMVERGTLRNGSLASYTRQGEENGVKVEVEGRLEGDTFRIEARENGTTRSLVIPRQSYDYTTMECPEAQLGFSGKDSVTLRILDVEHLAVVRREYRLVRDARYRVAGKEYPCRVVDFTDPNKNVRRWIHRDGPGVVVYRQDGRDDKASYTVMATAITKETEGVSTSHGKGL